MHEYSIVQALLHRVEAEADVRGASAVHRIHLRIGELSGVEIGLLQSAFEMIRERSICAGAELVIVPEEARWSCSGCGRTLSRGSLLRCRECGRPARLVEGGDILLDRLELEVA